MTAAALPFWSITELSEAIRRREISPVTLTETMLSRVSELDGGLKSYQLVTPEHARAQARAAEAELDRGQWRGPLHGVPIALKDLCFTKGIPTAGGMPIHAEQTPAFDATVTARLAQAGAVLLGKLKMTEGAFSAHHPSIEAPLNPWAADRWTGASSSGSGAATAAGLCFASLGSDTGGSIRFPSGACGLTGIKPTWGRVSRYGVMPLSDSLDHVGPMARSALDAGIVLGAIAGKDPNDPTSLPDPVPDYLAQGKAGNVRGLRIAYDPAYVMEGSDPAIVAALEAAIAVLEDLGADVRVVAMPDWTDVLEGWTAFCAVETAFAHLATYPARAGDYGPELKGLIDMGHATTGVEIARLQIARDIFKARLKAFFAEVDLMLAPVLTGPVPTVAQWADERSADVLTDVLKFTAPFDMAGNPTITLPGGFDANGVPIGLQFIGTHLAEPLLVEAGTAFQRVTDWHLRHPQLG